MLPAISFAAGAAVMLLFLRPAHADPLIAVTPTGLVVSWQLWMLAILAGAGGALKILDTVLVALKIIAPMTRTTVDDRMRDRVQVIDDAAHAKLDTALQMLGALIPGAGAGAAQPDRPTLTIAPAPRNTQAGRSRLGVLTAIALIGAALAGLALIGCTAAQRAKADARRDVVNCTAQAIGTTPGLDLGTLAAVVNLAAAERAKCSASGQLDWQCVKHDLIAQGLVLGGCTLAAMVADAAKAFTSGADRLSATTPVLPGRVELEQFRAAVAPPGVTLTYRTGAGDL